MRTSLWSHYIDLFLDPYSVQARIKKPNRQRLWEMVGCVPFRLLQSHQIPDSGFGMLSVGGKTQWFWKAFSHSGFQGLVLNPLSYTGSWLFTTWDGGSPPMHTGMYTIYCSKYIQRSHTMFLVCNPSQHLRTPMYIRALMERLKYTHAKWVFGFVALTSGVLVWVYWVKLLISFPIGT